MKISYTHEEIAEMIGTSRETVSRLLKNFRERKLISLKGSDLIIHDRQKLESIVRIQLQIAGFVTCVTPACDERPNYTVLKIGILPLSSGNYDKGNV